MKRWVVAALAVIAGLLVATGCSKPQSVAYRPIVFGGDNECWLVAVLQHALQVPLGTILRLAVL